MSESRVPHALELDDITVTFRSPEEREHQIAEHKMLPAAEVAEAILFAATRAPGVDVLTLRIEPLIQKLH